MISVTAAQLDAWLALFLFPLSRILALLAAAPVLSNAAMPARIRLAAGLAISLALAPALPPPPPVPAASWLGLTIVFEQILIGTMMGFALRLAFAALDVAGELIGLQMGLSFATFFDPDAGGQSSVIAQFLGLLAALVFLAMNGHLLAIWLVAESFSVLPVGSLPFNAVSLAALVKAGSMMFALGVLLALPLITALLVTNLALGVLARVAPALNIFAVGFPVTLALGFLVLMLSLPYMGAAMDPVFNRGFAVLESVLRAAAGK